MLKITKRVVLKLSKLWKQIDTLRCRFSEVGSKGGKKSTSEEFSALPYSGFAFVDGPDPGTFSSESRGVALRYGRGAGSFDLRQATAVSTYARRSRGEAQKIRQRFFRFIDGV